MKWMSGTTFCEDTFHDFAAFLGYQFQGRTACGIHLHSPDRPNKNRMHDLYGRGGVIGSMPGLLPLYDHLVRIFRENICSSGGNNDNIVNSLVNLLLLAKDYVDSEDTDADFHVDVMDFFYHEMYDAMVSGVTIPYAPYIMMLIKNTLEDEDLSDIDLEDHNYKKIYEKKLILDIRT